MSDDSSHTDETDKPMPDAGNSEKPVGDTLSDPSVPELNTRMAERTINEITGQMIERAHIAFETHEVHPITPDGGRFDTAKREEWKIVFNQTTGTHGWQIEDGTLAEGAYVEDVGLLVFENGWLFKSAEGWVKSDAAIERIQALKQRREGWYETLDETKAEVFTGDSRVNFAVRRNGDVLPGFWQFTPGEFEGPPEHVVAFRDGWDAAREDSDSTSQD
ncbi:hypothetical protein RYH80_18085 [Halobaculum sp. MBLA0147]|uniref:hypothetical protein n=1 Tax=Halobaculum sp. MBLA0147 TaxID=3079934 RepID=UPI0035240D09